MEKVHLHLIVPGWPTKLYLSVTFTISILLFDQLSSIPWNTQVNSSWFVVTLIWWRFTVPVDSKLTTTLHIVFSITTIITNLFALLHIFICCIFHILTWLNSVEVKSHVNTLIMIHLCSFTNYKIFSLPSKLNILALKIIIKVWHQNQD